jgi:exopolyphosphatase/guanosine-5'-triphosphate,3'-diphosphate pyrophosphatase
MTIASIDIGTNTVLLLIGTVGPDGRIEVLHDAVRAPRLGQGVDASRRLAPASILRVLDVLTEFRPVMDRHHPDRTIVTATSAVRDAQNRQEFIGRVREATGWDVRVLGGNEEAEWTFAGTVSAEPRSGAALVVDIGGGSTEISIGSGPLPSYHTSLDIGAVRITERLLRSTPPGLEELANAEAEIIAQLAVIPADLFTSGTAFAVAGTPTSLAAHLAGLRAFDRSVVDGYALTRQAVAQALRQLAGMTPPEIRALGSHFEGREDVITAGTLILGKVMDHFSLPRVRVSVRGLRYGALLAAATGR